MFFLGQFVGFPLKIQSMIKNKSTRPRKSPHLANLFAIRAKFKLKRLEALHRLDDTELDEAFGVFW